ncbi:MAG: phosphoribosylamine--glycine ligase [Syntrophorhabdaceae bacterium]|nr:phosphoribosylamine--glycine ligase [Syntrophorhabdaceae bacterium]
MKVLVIGGGGREHAIVWKLSQSKRVDDIFAIPGNGGISEIARCIEIDGNDIDGITSFAKRERIGLVVVGPEAPLSLGIVDRLDRMDIPTFGPIQRGALIETSKIFSKNLMEKYNIPTAPFKTFSDYNSAREYINDLKPPYVIKADGLCGGKGAYVISDGGEALSVLKGLMVDGIYGDAGMRVVVEDFLKGIEASYISFTDGKTTLPMLPSQDHKTLLDGDRGPNTGGMGAYTPVPFIGPDMEKKIDREIMDRTVHALEGEGIHYRGVLYAGLMFKDKKEPFVLEFNARMGDPETQPILFKMESDLYEIIMACIEGRLKEVGSIRWKEGVSVCVVLASKGYPERPEKGKVIYGLNNLKNIKDVMVFHAGTKRVGDRFVTSGGRVLGVTAIGDSYRDAINKAYEAVSSIEFEGMQYRKDIGSKAFEYL